jgi:predicted nucleic acid-binding protein
LNGALIVDANPLISSLLGGTARQVLLSDQFEFHSTQYTLFEVEKYLPNLARHLERPEIEIREQFHLLPVISHQPRDYENHISQAEKLIGGRDPKDVPILALTLQLGYPIWTEDRDFFDLPEITLYRTADLLLRIEKT